MPQHQAQQPAASLLFLIILIWLIFPGGDNPAQSLLLQDIATVRLDRFHHALTELNQSHWGDFTPSAGADSSAQISFLNLTGFREVDDLAWGSLNHFRETGLRLSRHATTSNDEETLWDEGHGAPVWNNASGTVHGDWVRLPSFPGRRYDHYNLSNSVPSFNWLGDRVEWARNMTGPAGTMLLRLEGGEQSEQYPVPFSETSPTSGGIVRTIRALASFGDTEGTGQTWEMRLWGVHWPKQGSMLLTTTSEKFEGIFGLPHLTLGPDFFESSQKLLNRTLATTIAKKEETVFADQNMPWGSDTETSVYTESPWPHCEILIYAQIHAPTPTELMTGSADKETEKTAKIIQAIESELDSPVGAPIPSVPHLQLSSIVWSPDCDFLFQSKGPPQFAAVENDHLIGMKSSVHLHQVKAWILVFAVVVFGQAYLMKSQIKESYTPSTMGRVSFATSSIIVIADGMTFTAAATWMSSAAATFLPTLALMFASFLSMTVGGSFLAKIHEVQLPEGRPSRREQVQAGSAPAAAAEVNAPLATQASGATANPTTTQDEPIIVPSDQDVAAEIADAASALPNSLRQQQLAQPRTPAQTFQAIIGRYILFSLCVGFLAISSTTWYPSLRSLFLNVCVLSYLSLWVPQIYRNILRNCRRALTWRFVVGQSVLRLLPVAYFWVKEDNFLYAKTDGMAFAVFCGWIWLQLFVLAAQDVVGPRFGIPLSWVPEVWDYHPILREDAVEAGGLPIGLVADDNPSFERRRNSEGEAGKASMRSIDCAICREVLEVYVIKAGDEATSVAATFARRSYMVTPCRHIFHSICLEGWLKFRLQCPICREELPPL